MKLKNSFHCRTNAGWLLGAGVPVALRDQNMLELMKFVHEHDERLVLSPEYSVKTVSYALPNKLERCEAEVSFLVDFSQAKNVRVESYELRSSPYADAVVVLRTNEQEGMYGLRVEASIRKDYYRTKKDAPFQELMLSLEECVRDHYSKLPRLEAMHAAYKRD